MTDVKVPEGFLPEIEEIERFNRFLTEEVFRGKSSGMIVIAAEVLRHFEMSPAWAEYFLRRRVRHMEPELTNPMHIRVLW